MQFTLFTNIKINLKNKDINYNQTEFKLYLFDIFLNHHLYTF